MYYYFINLLGKFESLEHLLAFKANQIYNCGNEILAKNSYKFLISPFEIIMKLLKSKYIIPYKFCINNV